jgi:hypothetical protein
LDFFNSVLYNQASKIYKNNLKKCFSSIHLYILTYNLINTVYCCQTLKKKKTLEIINFK